MNELLKIDHKEFGLTEQKVNELTEPFVPLTQEYKELIPQIESIKKEFEEK
jgi:hypothetical protein